ncbi:MAG: hypothetical protein LBS35_03090 [Synergistaceae bacterium]|jgi:ABC-type transport system substrate-binding protein|nr:hypothetical protein [Synergistaceae bacterium]
MADSLASRKSTAAVKSRQAARGGEGDSRKLILSMLLLVCCCAAGYFTWSTLQLLQSADDALRTVTMPQPPDPVAEDEKNEIATAEEGLNNLSQSSTRAMQTALMAETYSRFPIDLSAALVRSDPVGPGLDEIVIEPEPPSLAVVAIMITDTDSVAIISVDGEQDILVRKGAKFSEGTATITKIDAKGVTFTWRKKSYQVTL